MRRISPRHVAAGQAAYCLSPAAAPLAGRRRFESATGPKTDWWLVVTVSWLVGAIGAALALASGRRQDVPDEVQLLGGATAAALDGVDIFYVARGRVSRVYLLDAALELALALRWVLARRGESCGEAFSTGSPGEPG